MRILNDAADGNEGGKHHIISAAVSNGQLYIMKAQIGDKRWYSYSSSMETCLCLLALSGDTYLFCKALLALLEEKGRKYCHLYCHLTQP